VLDVLRVGNPFKVPNAVIVPDPVYVIGLVSFRARTYECFENQAVHENPLYLKAASERHFAVTAGTTPSDSLPAGLTDAAMIADSVPRKPFDFPPVFSHSALCIARMWMLLVL
jgi:hypothetical protein